MKVIVSGSRDFHDYDFVSEKLDYYLGKMNKEEIEIVQGAAKGVDALAKRYAEERGLKMKPFIADWYKLGTAAGPVRNRKMAEYADVLIAFYDGKVERSGTLNMIEEAKKLGLRVRVVNITIQNT